VPKTSGKMTDWERAICARVKTVRKQIRWAQPAFAEHLGITRDQLAAIEYGRTPLRYDIAWRLRTAFGISLLWLDCEDTLEDNFEQDELPVPNATGLPRKALLSEVVLRFHSPGSPTLKAVGPEPETRSEPVDEIARRSFSAYFLKMQIDEWIARLPDDWVAPFRDELFRATNAFLATLPRDPEDVVERRSQDLRWARIRTANARRILVAKNSQRNMLTEVTPERKTTGMTEMQLLLERLKRALEGMKKGDVARRDLHVPLPRLSEWLSGRVMPSGETALRLLHWVEQQERQTNTLGSANNTAKGKTQVRKSPNEKQTQVHKKK
jgi:transcriptional regulator with XRE-family HTH domain